MNIDRGFGCADVHGTEELTPERLSEENFELLSLFVAQVGELLLLAGLQLCPQFGVDTAPLGRGDDGPGPSVPLPRNALHQAAVFQVIDQPGHLVHIKAQEFGKLTLRGFKSAAGEGQHSERAFPQPEISQDTLVEGQNACMDLAEQEARIIPDLRSGQAWNLYFGAQRTHDNPR